jgi:hypothetical protein
LTIPLEVVVLSGQHIQQQQQVEMVLDVGYVFLVLQWLVKVPF